jgi:acyl-CoA thioester hydrolase
MNVMYYVGKFDEATWHLLASIGLTATYLRDHHRAMVAVRQEFEYKRELVAGDLIVIRSGVLEMRDKVIRFFHEMYKDETGELAATALLTGVHLDARARKSTPFPAEIVARGRALIVEKK